MHGRLAKKELDARVGQAFAARAYADLAALTADIPADPAAARLPRPPHRWPLARAAAKSGICLSIAAAAIWLVPLADANENGTVFGLVCFLVLVAVFTALGILGHGVVTSWKLRRPRRQLPPRPGPGGRALEGERYASTGQDPAPPGIDTDQALADLRAHKSRQDRQHISTREGRAPRGMRPALGTV